MATVDLSAYTGNQPEAVQVGDNVAICRISLSVTLSVGDVHRIGKIPHGAIPLDAVFYAGSALAANASILKLGTSASNDLFFASATYSFAGSVYRTTRPLGTAQQISLSDDKMPRYEALTLVGTAGLSIGFVGDLIVYYKMPGQTL